MFLIDFIITLFVISILFISLNFSISFQFIFPLLIRFINNTKFIYKYELTVQV